jgi:hypothetical protein
MATEKDVFDYMVAQDKRLASQNIKDVVEYAYSIDPRLRDAVAQPDSEGFGAGKATGIREEYPSERFRGIVDPISAMAPGFIKNPLIAIPAAATAGLATEVVAQGIQAVGGEPVAPKSFGESIRRQANAAIGGAEIESLGRVIGRVGSGMFKGMALTDFQRNLIKVADEKGIPLTPADVSKGSGWAKFENMLDQIPFTGVSEFTAKKLASFKNYLSATISKSGTNLDRQQIGEVIQDAINRRSQASRDAVNAAYKISGELTDSRALTPAKEFIDAAKKLRDVETRGLTTLRDNDIVRTADEILAKKFWNFEDLYANRQKIGEAIDKEMLSDVAGFKSKATPLARKWLILKRGLDDSIDTFFKNQPQEAQAALQIAKATAKENISTFGGKDILKLVNSAPEKVIDMVVKPNNATGIAMVRKAVGEDGFKPIKQRFVSDIIESSKLESEAAGATFEPSRIFTNLNKYEDSTLKAMFSPSEIKELNDIATLSMGMKTAERMAGNTSRTASNLVTLGAVGAGGVAAVNWKEHPVWATVTLLSAPVAARLYLSKAGRSLIINGLKAGPGTTEAAKAATRLSLLAGSKSFNEK